MSSNASKETLQDDVLVVDSGSFWEPGQYRRTVRRVDDGYSMCKELVNMIRDRCEIEAKYAQALKKHAEDWHKKIEHSSAYGTMKTAWNSMLREAEQQHDLHIERKDRLTDQLVSTIKSWLKDNYQKQTIPKPFLTKQAKEMDENFKRAQKQWAKLYDKVSTTKKQYYTSCQKEQMALTAEKNAKVDQGKSQDERLKLKDKIDKAADDKTKTKEKYEHALKEITNYNAKYIDDMQLVFDSCQSMEQKRLNFFKESLFGLHRSLYIYEDPRLKQIYLDLYANVESSDGNLDLKYWSDNYGIGMAMYWPSFEEYNTDATGTVSSKKYTKLGASGAVSGGTTGETGMLTAEQPTSESATPEASPKPTDGKAGRIASYFRRSPRTAKKTKDDEKLLQESYGGDYLPDLPLHLEKKFVPKNPFGSDLSSEEEEAEKMTVKPTKFTQISSVTEMKKERAPQPPYKKIQQHREESPGNPFASDTDEEFIDAEDDDSQQKAKPSSNPFGDDENFDDATEGVRVRALYGYNGSEEDELTFKEGDEFLKLEDEDEQGWCKGKIGDTIGLYPSGYVDELH